MSNPYEEFKKQNNLTKYLCNKCRTEMGKFMTDEGKDNAMAEIMKSIGQNHQQKPPAAFYCKNSKCERYGLLTKVAIIK